MGLSSGLNNNPAQWEEICPQTVVNPGRQSSKEASSGGVLTQGGLPGGGDIGAETWRKSRR